ncbi:MAG: 5-(carboxyamino)imidazole ribonucleotide mutase [Candidatus Omnitrophota bacterium]
MSNKALVGIVMGSDSDLETMQETTKILEWFGIAYDLDVISAHRTPQIAHEYASTAEKRGLEVIIAAAGGAAHLAGVIAAWTPLPVIGVPIQTQISGGLDSLLSMVQMPGGVPVATVATGKAGAKNAGILAAQILGVKDPQMREKIKEYKEQMAQEVAAKNKKLKEKQKEDLKEKQKEKLKGKLEEKLEERLKKAE